MKFRTDFVTNSSSSSFVIEKSAITPEQREMIYNYKDYPENILKTKYYGNPYEFNPADDWEIEEDEYFIRGRTILDNFDFEEYLLAIGVDPKAFSFSR